MEESKNVLSFSVEYDTDRELYTHVVKLYNLVCNKKITDREVPFVVYYLKYGYNKEVKKMLREELGVKSNHIDVINHKLREKGILIQDEYNKNNHRLCEEVLSLKSFVESSQTIKMIPIIFKNGN